MQSVIIRPAVPEDAAGLLEIYAPYVKRTAITFEYEAPSRAEFAARIGRTLARYPFLVALSGEEYLGYAYTGAFGGVPLTRIPPKRQFTSGKAPAGGVSAGGSMKNSRKFPSVRIF